MSDVIRKTRIWSGILLFIYVCFHLTNHSLGIISVDAMEAGRKIHLAFWRHPVINFILYFALISHVLVSIYTIFQKKTLKMGPKEWIQNIFALLIPFFLVGHLVAAFYGPKIHDLNGTYTMYLILSFMEDSGAGAIFFSIMLLLVWIHGVIGIHSLIMFKPFYKRFKGMIFFFYWLFPAMALMGFISGGKEAIMMASSDSTYVAEAVKETGVTDEIIVDMDYVGEQASMVYYPLSILIILAVLVFNLARVRIFRSIKLSYPQGKEVFISLGMSILDASRQAGIPHESVCGGKGRCTTCRVKVISGVSDLPPPNDLEKRVIERLNFSDDIRLACQVKPAKNMEVLPLISSATNNVNSVNQMNLSGREVDTVVLFIDLRDFTGLSESKLPYDVVYILNKYFKLAGEAIDENFGKIDKFIGDGVMAIFNSAPTQQENCKNAVKSAATISRYFKSFNEEMKSELGKELKFGIGIHTGPAIFGSMGHGDAISETTVGDTVNVASRLEQLSKDHSCELVISKQVADYANLGLGQFNKIRAKIRGKSEAIQVLSIKSASEVIF